MKTLQRFLSRAWRPALVVVTLGLIAYLLYFHRLGSLLPGYATQEATAHAHADSWHDLAANPLNLPYKVAVLALAIAGHHSLLTTRVTAALAGVVAVAIFFCITKAWYGFRVGFLGTVLFATSAGFLHYARLGTPQILQMGILMLIGILIWHRRAIRLRPYVTYLVVLTFGLLCYVPGMVWFELLVLVVMHRRIISHWRDADVLPRVAWASLGGLILAPLIALVVVRPHLALPLAGLPTDISQLAHLPLNLLHTVLSIGVQSNGPALLWVGHSPLVNAIELILGALGVYYYIYHERSLRSLLLASIGIVSIALISLDGGVSFACLVPIIYLLVSGGLSHFLGEWLAVFPRNPIAKGVGIGIACLMLFFSSLYQVRSYFVAWPHNSATRQVFTVPASRS